MVRLSSRRESTRSCSFATSATRRSSSVVLCCNLPPTAGCRQAAGAGSRTRPRALGSRTPRALGNRTVRAPGSRTPEVRGSRTLEGSCTLERLNTQTARVPSRSTPRAVDSCPGSVRCHWVAAVDSLPAAAVGNPATRTVDRLPTVVADGYRREAAVGSRHAGGLDCPVDSVCSRPA